MKKLLLLFFVTFLAFPWQVNAQVTTFPWEEDFEGSFLPAGWDKEIADYSNDITQSNSQNHTVGGQYSARFSSFNSSSDYNQYLFSVQITVTAPYTELSFWHRKYNSSSETLEWGISTTTQTSGAVSTWTAVSLSNTDWQETTVDLSGYVGQDIYIAWHYYGNYLYHVYLDDVRIDEPPSCPDPSDQSASNIGETQADLGWTENGSATTWDIELGAEGFTPTGTPTQSGVTNNPYTYTGLSAGTSYDWYVRADCGASGGSGQSAWVGPHTFSTTSPGYVCDNPLVVNSLPYSTTDNTSNYGDDYSSSDEVCSNSSYLNGDDVVYSYTPASDECIDITLTNTDTWVGLFVYEGCNPFTTCVASDKQSGGNPSLSGVTLTGGTTYYIVISTYPSPQSTAYDMVIDNCPTCVDPTNQTESNVTYNSADLDWDENSGNTSWDIEWGPTGFTQGSGTTISGITTKPYTLSGLSESTTYDWYVRSDCGGGTYTNWVGPSTFTTPATPPANDECSGAITLTVGNPGDCPTNQVSGDATSATDDGYTSCDDVGENIGVWYSFVAPASGEVVVNYSAGTATGDPGIVVYDACGGNEVPNSCQNNPATLSNITGLTGSTTYYMLLWFDGSASAGSFDICLEDVGTCPKPSAQTESNITSTSADLDWTESGSATTWDIEWGATGFTQGSGTTVTGITSKPYTLNGLTANTTYDWYVRADCGASGGTGQSAWTGPHTFTTSPPPPSNDLCSGAISLTVGSSCTMATYNNDGATDSGETPAPGCGNYNGADVWFSFTVPAMGYVIIDSDVGDITDGAMAAYSGSCGSLTLIECDDDDSDNGAMPKLELQGLTAGSTVYIRFWEYGGNVFGDFDICVYEGPCEIPTGLTASNETTSGADLSWTENGGADHWDLFIVETSVGTVPDASTTPTVDNTTDNPYTWTGGNPSTDYDWYVRADCGASGGSGTSDWSAKGTFTTLSADAVDWCNLQWPDQATYTVCGSEVDVYAQVYEPGVTDASGQGAGISAWIGYSTTDTDPATWTDWVTATYNVDSGNNDEYKAALGNGLVPGTYYYASRFKLNSGEYSYGGYSSGGGGFWDGSNYVSGVLTVDPAVANDDCDNAIALSVGDGACFDPEVSTNDCATDSHEADPNIPAPGCANYQGGDVWFKVVVPASGNITIQTSKTDGFSDAGMAAYSGSCGSLTLIECDDDGNNNPGTNTHSRLELTGQTAGATLYIRVWEYGNNSYGNFAICAWEPKDAVVSLIGDGSCESGSSVDISNTEGNTYTWVPLVDGSNNIIAYLFPYGNELGSTSATIYRNTTGTIREDSDNVPYIDRDVQVTVTTQPSGSNPRVRIAYTQAEINALVAADAQISGIGDIDFTKTATNCTGSYNGSGESIPQTSNAEVNSAGDSYIQCTVSGFSTFYANRSGAILPIKLISFDGYAEKNVNILQWSAISEINSNMFIVERSVDGIDWEVMTKVEANGNSNVTRDYKAIDKQTLNKAFYRLRIMDADGRFLLSDVIVIERNGSDLKLFGIYPNPNDGNFVISYSSEPNKGGQMFMVNTLGVKVFSKKLNNKGGRYNEKINVDNLPNGIYTILIEQNDIVITKRVVINK